ncbi:DNA-binding transcriptional regulator Fis [Motiliproteus coralliicola]|uniref:Putative Fis-like DNA-binding protein n=1 Tax=Motiliproteus coralliicola TaxID=2283196 RepID=A0A369WF10_9GAMM|nr:DNA-binding transcriptional regulator Fis [Motiliproteus coralliicola]RDE19941.1 DNA-binding transcriptional regulator Fis [Motiliproteus coralliicola]
MTLGSTQIVTEQETPLQLSDSAANEPNQPKRLRHSVSEAMENYFKQLDGQPACNVYELVLNEIEAPLLEAVMQYTRDNQTKASEVLGLNRGTLRKKLKQYGLL